MDIQVIAIIIDLIIALAVTQAVLTKPRMPGGRSLVLMVVFAACWSAFDIPMRNAAQQSQWTPLLIAAAYLAAMLAASAQLTYAVAQSNPKHWIRSLRITWLAVLPVLSQVVFWIKPLRDVIFGSAQSQAAIMGFLGGRFIAAYVFMLMGASLLLLVNTYFERPDTPFIPFGALLLGSLLPPIAAIVDLGGYSLLTWMAFLPIGFALAGLAYAYYFFKGEPEVAPSVDRNAVVEGMDDGWMVLDRENVVIDMNPAAERMAGLTREQAVGQPVTSMLGNLPNLAQTFDSSQELEMKRSIKSEDGWKYLNIRISPLKDREHQPFGRLALWRDVTERKLTEDARQRARDEMLVLLNAISSAASNVVDLDDFLSESIYHIIYPFRSQVVAFFLLNEKNEKQQESTLIRSAHLGLSAQAATELASVPASASLFASVLAEQEPLQIEDVEDDPRVPAALKAMGLACLLVIPLINQSGEDAQVLGCMCLARKDKPVFSTDESVRLTMISDQIAALIDSDRRRKLAITSTERKRLMRDLHDSVSQKLYGLVTTTEAAQAAIEAGSEVNPSEILARIGENARQAVKEMRLFLFQMQPIDMEKDGLISLLHHRLAAVEGRADIKARLRADLADDEVALSKETQVVLYYVAQEALNNVLRHAAAKSISVTLKQGTRNVILEILDDGCGFDPRKVERGGLGLTNMRERTAQIHGKLQIVSKTEGGTKVVITVPKDPSVKPVRHRR